jgi:pimeloyl-ACP methyl ester carboxylesterase
MRQQNAVDGFHLVYDRAGTKQGPPVVLLHGWPGDRTDYRALVPLLAAESLDVIVPDLRGFGESDKQAAGEYSADGYSAAAQARGIVALIDELELDPPVLAGYDIGSRIAQAIARDYPDRVRALVVAPPLPGIGGRILNPDAQREFWYQAFHNLDLCERLIDGNPQAVRDYLSHFWTHWSGPHSGLPGKEALDHLTEVYSPPGAFTASITWYRAGSGAVAASLAEKLPDRKIAVPTTVLWPSHDPLFPPEWSDRLDDFFADVTLTHLDGVGHFTPLERPRAFAAAVLSATKSHN